MAGIRKPNVRGPAPSEKAQKALGEKLNRPAKPPPPIPRGKIGQNDPPARRVKDEVEDL